MAARFWRSLLGCELALATALAAVVAHAFQLSAMATFGAGLGLAVLVPVALVAVSFVVATLASTEEPAPRRVAYSLRAALSEALDFNLAALAMAAGRDTLPPIAEPGPAASQHPVRPLLLIHGILCNRGVWRDWLERLRAEGFVPIRAVSLEPLFADLGQHAAQVARELCELQRECRGARVAVIAHSMGGLVARAALRSTGPAVIDRIVTLASPHHGTRLAGWFGWLPTQQMTPGSSWLRALNAEQEGRLPVPFTSIYSLEDNLIVPPRSARLDGALMRELRGLGHLGMVGSRQALEHAVAALAGA